MDIIENILAHHGVKGMKWGVRRRDKTPTTPEVSQKGKKLKSKGGENQPAHEDAIKARQSAQIAKESGHIALSNKELEDYARRLDLEQRVKRLESNEQSGVGKWVKGLLKREGQRSTQEVADKATDKAVRKVIKKANLEPA